MYRGRNDGVFGAPAEENFKFLDPQKVGKEFRRGDQGTFTQKGYVCKNGKPFQEMYDGNQYPEIPDMRKGPLSCIRTPDA